MRGLFAGLTVAAVIFAQTGCSSPRGRLARMLPASQTYDDSTEDSSDPWIAGAAGEGRAGFETEKEPDPFGWKPMFMSQKARDIEKNLGVE